MGIYSKFIDLRRRITNGNETIADYDYFPIFVNVTRSVDYPRILITDFIPPTQSFKLIPDQ